MSRYYSYFKNFIFSVAEMIMLLIRIPVQNLNNTHDLIKFSRASSRVNWLKMDKTDVSRTISVLVLRVTEVGCNPVPVIYIPARAQCL
jgi:hypothetical protein